MSVSAYILIQSEVGKAAAVAHQVRSIPGVVGADEWADARDWCTGFLQAVDLMPGAWGDAFADPTLIPLLQLGGGLPGLETPALPDDEDLAAVDQQSRAVPDAVLQLRQRLRPG